MESAYDRIAGLSEERLTALRDGIFGVAMTLLALDLHVPVQLNYSAWTANAGTPANADTLAVGNECE